MCLKIYTVKKYSNSPGMSIFFFDLCCENVIIFHLKNKNGHRYLINSGKLTQCFARGFFNK